MPDTSSWAARVARYEAEGIVPALAEILAGWPHAIEVDPSLSAAGELGWYVAAQLPALDRRRLVLSPELDAARRLAEMHAGG